MTSHLSFGLKFQHACEGLSHFAETLASKATRQLDKLESKVLYAFTKTQWENNRTDFAKLEAKVDQLKVYVDQHPDECSFEQTNELRQGIREMKKACQLLKGPEDKIKAKQAHVKRLYAELTTIEDKITNQMIHPSRVAAFNEKFKPKNIKTVQEEPITRTKKEKIGKSAVDDIGVRDADIFLKPNVAKLMQGVQALKRLSDDKYNLANSLTEAFGTASYNKILNDLLNIDVSKMKSSQVLHQFDIILKIVEQGIVTAGHGVFDENERFVEIDEKSKPDLHKAYNDLIEIYDRLIICGELKRALKELMTVVDSPNKNLKQLLEKDVLNMSQEQMVKHFEEFFVLVEKEIVEAKLGVFTNRCMVIDQSHKKLYQAYEKAIDSFNKIADFSKSLMTREARKAQVTADYTKARAKIGRQLNDFVGHLQQKYPLVASLGKYWGERSTDNTRLVFLLDQNFEKMKAKDVVDSAREILKIIRHGMHYDRLKKEIFVDDHDRMAAMDRVVDEFEKRFAKKA